MILNTYVTEKQISKKHMATFLENENIGAQSVQELFFLW